MQSKQYVNQKKYFVSKLLNDNDLNSRVISREKKYMIYIKEAEKIRPLSSGSLKAIMEKRKSSEKVSNTTYL